MIIFNTNKDIKLKELVVSCLSLEQAQASCKTLRHTRQKQKWERQPTGTCSIKDEGLGYYPCLLSENGITT